MGGPSKSPLTEPRVVVFALTLGLLVVSGEASAKGERAYTAASRDIARVFMRLLGALVSACGQFSQLLLVEGRLRLGLLWMKRRGAVEHPLRHVAQAVLAHAEPHDAWGKPYRTDHVLLLDGDSPDLLAYLIVLLLRSTEPRPVELQ